MSESTRLLDQLRRAFDGEPWSGPSLLATLDGLTAAQAAGRPFPSAHSIWEITRHLAVWSGVVRRRLFENQMVQISDAEDWPPQPSAPTDEQWQAALADLNVAHEQLLLVTATISDAGLDNLPGATFDPPLGPDATAYVMLHGIAQHYLYHAGQIALLRKAVV